MKNICNLSFIFILYLERRINDRKKPNDTNGFRYTYEKNGLLVYAIKEEPDKLPITYEYAYSDGKIKQIRINKYIDNISYQFPLEYLYDEDGVKGFSYRYRIKDSTEITHKMYLYKKNILGDIIGIYEYNNDGNNNCTLIEVASYKYDAYGNHKVYNSEGIEETSKLHIDNINPLRYRGYYYDVETQLFYCNSRYYSPELCRWISPDSIEYLDPKTINGLNLYCYCKGNPVLYVDPDGESALFFALSVLLSTMIAVVIMAVEDENSFVSGPKAEFTGVEISTDNFKNADISFISFEAYVAKREKKKRDKFNGYTYAKLLNFGMTFDHKSRIKPIDTDFSILEFGYSNDYFSISVAIGSKPIDISLNLINIFQSIF